MYKRQPYHGAAYAVVESVAKLVAAGGDPEKIYLTLQEYFPRTKGDPRRWGLPFSALLGALSAQINLGYAAIGGKDSMSGTFEDIDVPPTLVSFAVSYTNIANIISPEFKRTDSELYWLPCPYDQDGLPDYSVLRGNLRAVAGAIRSGGILSCYAPVSYTHLDVYKRQDIRRAGFRFPLWLSGSVAHGDPAGAY